MNTQPAHTEAQARAVALLTAEGYEAKADATQSDFVVVLDPVQCQNGLRKWTEYDRVWLNVNTRAVARFLAARD